MQLLLGDCLEVMKEIPDNSVDLVLTDPPYNIGVTRSISGKEVPLQWDKIPNYGSWCMQWLRGCHRVLKANGVLYFWHNNIPSVAEILTNLQNERIFEYVSFCIWDKGTSYRARSWKQLKPDGRTPLRSWFNVCEYCIHLNNRKDMQVSSRHHSTVTGMLNDDPDCYRELKDWYNSEKQYLGLTDREIKDYYRRVTCKEPHMFSHYFSDKQFDIPSRQVWDMVFIPLSFRRSWEDIHNSLEKERRDNIKLREKYDELRYYHYCDPEHCNIWHIPPVPSYGRKHTCQKPLNLLERLIAVSCKPGGG